MKRSNKLVLTLIALIGFAGFGQAKKNAAEKASAVIGDSTNGGSVTPTPKVVKDTELKTANAVNIAGKSVSEGSQNPATTVDGAQGIERAQLYSKHGLNSEAKSECIQIITSNLPDAEKATAYYILGLIAFDGAWVKATQDKPSDLDKIQGVWKMVGIDYGEPKDEALIPGFEAAMEKFRVVIKGNRLFTLDPGLGNRQYIITLDSTKEPKHIDISPLDEEGKPRSRWLNGKKLEEPLVHETIYKLDGDTLTILFIEGIEKLPRPTEFKGRPHSKHDPDSKEPRYALFIGTLKRSAEPVPEIKN